MEGIIKSICIITLLFNGPVAITQRPHAYNAIYSGIPWFDEKRNLVSPHGACILNEKGRFYLFGGPHSDNSNLFAGFNCYSSADLYNLKFERVALPVQDIGKLGPNQVGERVKVYATVFDC